MIQTLEDVIGNNFVNHFEEISKAYNLEGLYIKYYSSKTKQDEIYFVCGTDKEKIHSNVLNVESAYTDTQKQYLYHNPNIAVFKITGNDPLLTHQEVVAYCQTTEFLCKLYQEHDTSLPSKLPKGIVNGLKMAYHNATNPALPIETQQLYVRDIKETIKKQDALFTDHGTDSKKVSYYINQQYDTQKSKLSNWIKRKFSPNKNMVSIEHLMLTCKEVTTVGVRMSDAQTVQKELQNHPEIIYWMSDKPIGHKLECPDDQGFGSQKANDQRYIAFSFDSEYSTDFIAIINKIEHPDAYKTTVEDLISKYEFIQHISIQANDYEKYITAFNSRGIRYCITDNSDNADIIHLVIACDIRKNIDSILEKISKDTESRHLYTNPEERQRVEQQDYLDKQKTRLETEILERAETIFGFSDVEMVSISGDLTSDEPSNLQDDIDLML